jgi:alpha-amylase/alpha-mannosidase (GH57 family)
MSILPLQHPIAFTEINIALGNNINETGADKATNNPFSHVLVPMFSMTGWGESMCRIAHMNFLVEQC